MRQAESGAERADFPYFNGCSEPLAKPQLKDRTHNEAKFQGDLASSASKLRQSLDSLAARLPGNNQALSTALNARVDSLLHDLTSSTTRPSTDLIRSDQSGAHADVATYIHDEVANGDFSLR